METYRQTIYCDLGFLEAILSKQDNEMSCLDNSHYIDEEIAASVRELLLSSDVKLHLNMSQEEFDKIDSSINKKRLKAAKKGLEPDLTSLERIILVLQFNQKEGQSHLHLNSLKFQFGETPLDEKYLNAIFFTNESREVCAKVMEQNGILAICLDNLSDFKYLFYDNGAALQHHERSDWKQCLLEKHNIIPCNSLIIVDNYILNEPEKIDSNLPLLLDSLIPNKLDDSLFFHLTIFALLCSETGSRTFNIKSRWTQVSEILKRLRPDMNFSFSVIKCSKGVFHDRNIVSSNLFIGCGAGFDLFKDGKSGKATTICAFHPTLYAHSCWSKKAYSVLLDMASHEYKRSTEYNETIELKCVYFGDKQNRLLDLINSQRCTKLDL